MKKAIALFICVLLGSLLGYFSAPILFMWVAQSSEPEMFTGSMLANYKSSVVCECNDRPPSEGVKELSEYLSILKGLRAQNQGSKMLAQEVGLGSVRLSTLESKLNQRVQADEDMRRGQEELAKLGWKDFSKAHLTSLVSQLNSEYKPFDRKSKTLSTSVTAQ